VSITDGFTSVTSAPATLTVVAPTRITNLSLRAAAGSAAKTSIVGFTVAGKPAVAPKPLLIRGVGPTLGGFGVTNALADPKLSLYDANGSLLSVNSGWGGNPQVAIVGTQVGAFALNNPSRDAAIYTNSAIGTFSVQLTSQGGATGIALAEIYDATPLWTFSVRTQRLINVSARAQAGSGADTLIAGFAIAGSSSKTVLIRAIGPTLAKFGVAGALSDPKLELYNDGAAKLNENDDWGGGATLANAFTSVGAFSLDPTSKDAALLATLAPGGYTAQVSGVGGTTGVALVEIYEMP